MASICFQFDIISIFGSMWGSKRKNVGDSRRYKDESASMPNMDSIAREMTSDVTTWRTVLLCRHFLDNLTREEFLAVTWLLVRITRLKIFHLFPYISW